MLFLAPDACYVLDPLVVDADVGLEIVFDGVDEAQQFTFFFLAGGAVVGRSGYAVTVQAEFAVFEGAFQVIVEGKAASRLLPRLMLMSMLGRVCRKPLSGYK